MIEAFCDRCGAKIDADVKAGCRVVMGNREWTFHLCTVDQAALREDITQFLRTHEWRTVK